MDIEEIIKWIVILSPIWVGAVLYYLYGREYTAKDVGYIQVYERYPPTPDKGPLFAQYITWGKVDFRWLIPAWFLSLYQKGYLKKEGNRYVYQEGKEP
ncbi:MAG: hypothetical protein GXN92_02775, partial [Candidatus Micrarchaeota archaeon]|nr:hypothetical protein [Candidatus Micrarchaeota archaeon]